MSSKYGYMATIGADTSGLKAAMTDFDKVSKNISSELKQINTDLKFDDGGTVALQQKYDLLSDAIENSKKKLEQLKAIEEKVNQAAASGDISQKQQREYQRELESTQNKLVRYQHELEETENKIKGTAKATEEAAKETEKLGKSALAAGDIFKATTFSNLISDGIKKAVSWLKDFGEESLETASNIAEVQNVVDVTFGDSAAGINKWAANAKEAFGISELAAKQYTGTMGALLKSSGVTVDKIEEMSETLAGLSGDIASFYNLDVDVAFQKIRSGIAGETEPLKQLGINMSVANMEAFALAQGIEKSWKNMSQAEQTMLRYEYLLSQTTDAQGDFNRTVDSFANQQRILELNTKELKAQFGEQLLPVVNEIFSTLNKELPDSKNFIESTGKVIASTTKFIIEHKEAILSVASAYLTFQGTLKAGTAALSAAKTVKELTESLKKAKTAQEALNTVTEANPWVLLASVILAATVALSTYAATADTTFNKIRDVNKEMKNSDKALKDNISNSEAEIAVVKKKADEYEELRKKYEETGEGEERLKALAEDLQQYMPKGTKLIDEQTGAYNSLAGAIDGVVESMRRKAYIAAYEERYSDAIKQQLEANEALGKATEEYNYILTHPSAMPAGASALTNINFNNAVKAADKANKTVEEIENKLNELYSTAPDTNNNYGTAPTGNWLADYYQKKYKEEKEAKEKAKALRDEQLADYVSSLDDELALRRISEEQYYEKLKGYLDNNKDTESKAWYKQLGRYESYIEKKKAADKKAYEDQLNAQKKAADDAKKAADAAEKERIDAIKKSWDRVTALHDRGEIDDEKEYKLKAQIVKKYCSENEDTWDEYYKWLYNYTKKNEEKIAKEKLDAWKKNSQELADELKKSYSDLIKQKETVKKELLNIDLTETVKDKDGNELTILTDLDAQIRKIDKYKASLARLKSTGISDSLLDKIYSMNFENGSRQNFIDTLLGLSPAMLQRYYSDWERLQKKSDDVSQDQVQDKLDELNSKAKDGVLSMFGSIPPEAYEEGLKTADSYLQGIIDGMGDLNGGAAEISKLMNSAKIMSFPKFAENNNSGNINSHLNVISVDTPVTINLNDKKYIDTTVNGLIEGGRLSGGNNFKL